MRHLLMNEAAVLICTARVFLEKKTALLSVSYPPRKCRDERTLLAGVVHERAPLAPEASAAAVTAHFCLMHGRLVVVRLVTLMLPLRRAARRPWLIQATMR